MTKPILGKDMKKMMPTGFVCRRVIMTDSQHQNGKMVNTVPALHCNKPLFMTISSKNNWMEELMEYANSIYCSLLRIK